MADPLSIAASVGGLALLARDIVKQVASVISTARGATSQLQALRHSVALLYGYLESLDSMLEDQDDSPAPLSILACNKTLDKIQGILKKCRAEQEPPASSPTPTSSTSSAKPRVWQGVKQKVRWVIDKDEVEKLLADLEKHKSVLSLALSKNCLSSVIEVLKKQDETLQHIQDIKKEQSQIRQQQIQDNERRLSKERRKMLSTVSQMRPEDSFKKHFSLHQDGTGVWFLESPEFEKFMSNPNSKLWLYGIPGAGKSVLSATIIDHISTQRTEHVALASFFCEYFNTATQTCRNIFGSIAKQLALQNLNALKTLEEFFNDQTNLGESDFNPEDDELLNLIVQMSTNFENTIIVIDGLDECQESRPSVVESLVQLSRGTVGSIKTLYASRKEPDIQERLSSFDSLAIAASKADVRLYVAAQLKSRFRNMCEKDPALSEQILTVLVDKSEGMFQWVRCQIDCLENLASNKQRRKALEDLPRDLHGTYERILLRAIKSSEHATLEFVERTLRWIALAMKPLSVAEIAHAVSVEVEDRSFDDSLDMRIILALCSSLVREVNGDLAFSHFSVKEYLMQISPEQGQLARFRISDSHHSILARTCLTYLLLDDFNRQSCVTPDDLRPVDDTRGTYEWAYDPYPRYPLYRYATFRWIEHAEACGTDDAVLKLVKNLFDPVKTDQFLFWAHLQLEDIICAGNISKMMYDITPLHLACIFGLTDLVDMLLCQGANPNAISAVLGSPLRCVVTEWDYGETWGPDNADRHETVRRLLSEPISKDQSRYDPLADALSGRNEEMASILLEHGFTLTRSAVAILTSDVVPEFLLTADLKDLDVEIELCLKKKFGDLDFLRSSRSLQNGARRTELLPLHSSQDYMEIVRESCSHGRLESVQNLVPCLENSLTEDRLSNFLSQCLVESAAHGHLNVVQYLTEASADPAFQRHSDGRTALHEASKGCHADVVRTLLEISDDGAALSGIQDNDGLTPWMCAIKAGSVETLKLFLAGPSTINFQTAAKNGQKAAHLATGICNEKMVLYLKEIGVDFTCLDESGATPIHALLKPHCDWFYSFDDFESCRQIFRHLQRSDMLSEQTHTGQTLVHMIALLNPRCGKLLWQDIRDNQIFDTGRDQSLVIVDSEGNSPLHVLVHRLAAYLKDNGFGGDLRGSFVEFIQLLLIGNSGEFEQLHRKNQKGRTPAMELAWSIQNIEVSATQDKTIPDHLLDAFKSLEDTRTGYCCLGEMDNDKRTVLHYIAGCRTYFPFKQITEYLLERPIDVTVKDSVGISALMRAAWGSQQNVDFMRLLIPRMGVSQLEDQDSNRKSILHSICTKKKAGIQDLINDHLLQQIGECEKKSRSGRIPLMYAPAVITEDEIASRLIQFAGKTVEICDNDGKNCMYWSCELGSIAMVSALLDAGVNIDAPLGPESDTGAIRGPPLLIAASSKQFRMVEVLLGRGADPLAKGEACWQLHHYAFDSERHELLPILENLTGFDYNAKAHFEISFGSDTENVKDATPLHFTAVDGDKHGLQWLFDHDKISDIDVETRDGSTPLILASQRGHHDTCKRLIELGSLIPKPRHDGYTALHAGCQYGHLEVCKLLIATDNSCVFQKFGVQTPLEIAARNGHKDIVELLLKHEAEATIEAEISARKASHHDIAELIRRRLSIGNKTSPENAAIELDSMRLKAACAASSESTLVEVLQKDLNPNIRLSYKHWTPLHLACRNGWKAAVELLVERYANIEAVDQDGDTPLMVAISNRKWECTELLCGKGAQITTRDKYGHTVLHRAADNQDSISLSHFLKQGVEPNIRAYEGTTPLHWASDPECVGLLLEYGADPFSLSYGNAGLAWRYSRQKRGGKLLRKVFGNQPIEKVQQNIELVYSRYNSTSLYQAAFQGNSDVVFTLIEYGAEVNGHCGPLGAPVHAALKQGHTEVATILLEMGARPYRIVRGGEENAGWFWEYGYEFCLQGQNGVWMSHSF